LTCKFCDPFWDWLWKKSGAWEREHSNESELWSKETQQSRELIEQASAIEDTRPAAFRLYLEAAEGGSAWAMERVGWQYQTGTAVTANADKALEFYHRAICAGSWMATIHYAQLLEKLGHHDHCDQVLKDGVASDFVPAYFWLARFRYKRSKRRRVCRGVRPFLEYAAIRGHPRARVTLAQWMLWGRLGLREIPRGLKFSFSIVLQLAFGPEGYVGVDQEHVAV
jgi:hypothetical protein